MSGIDNNTESVDSVREKLEDLKVRYAFREPERGDLENPDIEWRIEKPDYTKANYQYLKGKTQNHTEGNSCGVQCKIESVSTFHIINHKRSHIIMTSLFVSTVKYLSAFVFSCTHHFQGSLEDVVENLVKKWEMQASHFKNFDQWTEIDHENYKVSVNGRDFVDGHVAYEIGNYNALMADCPAYKKCQTILKIYSHHS